MTAFVSPRETRSPSKTEHRIATALGFQEAAERQRDKAERGRVAAQKRIAELEELLAEMRGYMVTVQMIERESIAVRLQAAWLNAPKSKESVQGFNQAARFVRDLPEPKMETK